MSRNTLNTLKEFPIARFQKGQFYSLPALEKTARREHLAPAGVDPHRAGIGAAQLRRQESHRRTRPQAGELGRRPPSAPTRFRSSSRASCCRTSPACRCWPTWRRCATSPRKMGKNPKKIEPLVPVDLVVDHSVQIDHYRDEERARPEYEAGIPAQQRALPVHEMGHAGIRHVRRRAAGLRHRAPGQPGIPGARRAQERRASTTRTRWSAPTRHTTMINGIGVVGWGVGGIEAEAGMLGQPVYFLTPDVVGVNLTGQLREGVTATDLVLTITEMLRKEKVVGKFVEFFGEGTALAVADRPRDDRQHGAGIRRHHGLLPGRRSNHRLLQRHRPHQGEIDAFEATSRRRACSACRRPATSTTPTW